MLFVIHSKHKLEIYTYFCLSYIQGTARGLTEAYERNLENFEGFTPFKAPRKCNKKGNIWQSELTTDASSE